MGNADADWFDKIDRLIAELNADLTVSRNASERRREERKRAVREAELDYLFGEVGWSR
jgi:hypothetical protein